MGIQVVRKTILSLCGGLALAAATQSASAGNVDEKLLAMLKANGSITEAQYTELSSDLVAEQREEAHDSFGDQARHLGVGPETQLGAKNRDQRRPACSAGTRPGRRPEAGRANGEPSALSGASGHRLAGRADGRSRHSSCFGQQQRCPFDQPGHEQLLHQEGRLAGPCLHQLAPGERAGTEDDRRSHGATMDQSGRVGGDLGQRRQP